MCQKHLRPDKDAGSLSSASGSCDQLQTKVEECRGLSSRADAPGCSCEDASNAFRHGASTGLAQHVQHDMLAGGHHPHPGHHVPHYGQCQQQRCSKGICPLWHATVYTTGHSYANCGECVHACRGPCDKTTQPYARTGPLSLVLPT